MDDAWSHDEIDDSWDDVSDFEAIQQGDEQALSGAERKESDIEDDSPSSPTLRRRKMMQSGSDDNEPNSANEAALAAKRLSQNRKGRRRRGTVVGVSGRRSSGEFRSTSPALGQEFYERDLSHSPGGSDRGSFAGDQAFLSSIQSHPVVVEAVRTHNLSAKVYLIVSLVYVAMGVTALYDLSKPVGRRWILTEEVQGSSAMWAYLVIALLLWSFRNDFPFNLIVLCCASAFLGYASK